MKVTRQLRNSVIRTLQINDQMRTSEPQSAIEDFLWFVLIMAMAGGLVLMFLQLVDSIK